MTQRTFKGFLIILTILLPWHGAAAANSPTQEVIRGKIEKLWADGELTINGAQVASHTILPDLYVENEFNLLWHNSANITTFLQEIDKITDDGLDPIDYHAPHLQALHAQLAAGSSSEPGLLAKFDILLTDALIRISYHLAFGKVDPEALDHNWNMARELENGDAVMFFNGLISSDDFTQRFKKIGPQIAPYRRLQGALKKYRAIQAAGGWEPVPQSAALKKGMPDPRIPSLRRRLIATGDLAETQPDSDVFDSQLEQAVITFQKRHGLEADGVVGKRTFDALNVSVESRINQIRVNLERARWVFHNAKGKFVVADIAGFKLILLNDDEIFWTCRVQVGKTYRKTPVFKATIKYIEFNPTWTIPPGILRKDTLPAVKRDPNYLKDRHIRVLDQNGKPVDQDTIDWSKYPKQGFPYILRQDPGSHNALGLIKFMFPNKHFVFLHDTPHKEHFADTVRAFSSGCIRVEKPFELAELLLDDPERWNREQIMKVIESGKTRAVHLKKPIPVMLLYWTVGVEDNGTVHFKKDLYKRDQAILDAMRAEFKFRKRPVAGRPIL